MTRESWLTNAVDAMRPWFQDQGATVPPVIHAITSWPTQTPKNVIGQCARATPDESVYVIVTPKLVDPIDVLATVVHELVHATGIKGHGADFKKLARAVGLTGKMSATVAGPELRERLTKLAERLGPYPHTKLDLPVKDAPARRSLIKYVSPTVPEFSVYLTKTALALSVPICPFSGKLMVPL